MNRTFALLVVLAASIAGCSAFPRGSTTAGPTSAVATIRGLSGQTVGTATLTQTNAGILITGSVNGIGVGTHGFHIHAVGRCEAPFTTAGGHFNPANAQHGFRNPQGPHGGDITNLAVPTGDALTFDVLVPNAHLGGDNGVMDADGAALVVHAAADDYLTDPAGNSGARIACGVITAR